MGLLFNEDALVYREFFKEQAALLGLTVKYQYPVDLSYNLQGIEDQLGFSEPIDLNIILEQSPKLKTLKKFGWVSEDPEDKPWICQVPYDTPNLQVGCHISFNAPDPLDSRMRVFKVTDISVDQILPDSYYCKLAPVFEKDKAIKPEEYKDKSYTYLKVDQNAI